MRWLILALALTACGDPGTPTGDTQDATDAPMVDAIILQPTVHWWHCPPGWHWDQEYEACRVCLPNPERYEPCP